MQHKERIKELRTERRRAHAHRDADPAHARDVAHRHPRPVARATRRPRIASRSSPTSASTTRAPSSEAIRRELLREGQVFFVHNRVKDIEHVADDVRELVPEARVAVAHGQMDESAARAGRARVLGARARRARVHDDRRERPRHADGEHARRRPRRPARARAALPAARPRRPPRAARVRVPPVSARPRALRGGVRAAEDDRRVHRPRLRLQDRDARPRDPRRGQPARRRAVGPHRRGRLRPLRRDGHRGGRRAHRRDARGARPRCRSTCRSTAHLPRDYIARDDVRMEAYRRLAAVTTPADVDDVRAEWEDRYGPPPRRPRRCSTSRGCGPNACGSASARCRCRRAWRASTGSSCASRRRCGSSRWSPAPVSCPTPSSFRCGDRRRERDQALLRLLEVIVPAEAAPVPSTG